MQCSPRYKLSNFQTRLLSNLKYNSKASVCRNISPVLHALNNKHSASNVIRTHPFFKKVVTNRRHFMVFSAKVKHTRTLYEGCRTIRCISWL